MGHYYSLAKELCAELYYETNDYYSVEFSETMTGLAILFKKYDSCLAVFHSTAYLYYYIYGYLACIRSR